MLKKEIKLYVDLAQPRRKKHLTLLNRQWPALVTKIGPGQPVYPRILTTAGSIRFAGQLLIIDKISRKKKIIDNSKNKFQQVFSKG